MRNYGYALLGLLSVCLWPLGDYIYINANTKIHWFSTLLTVAILFFAALLIGYLIKNITLVSILLAVLFSYKRFNIFLALWLGTLQRNSLWLTAALLIFFGAWRFGSRYWVQMFSGTVLATLAVTSLVAGILRIPPRRVLPVVQVDPHRVLPNIYWIGLDSYPQGSVFSELLDFDNSPFEQFLKDNQFKIASNSYSGYWSTTLSLSSTFKMDYLSDGDFSRLSNAFGVSVTEVDVVNQGNHDFLAWTRSHGYQFIQVDSSIRCSTLANICIENLSNIRTSLASTYLWMTPLEPLMSIVLPRAPPISLINLKTLADNLPDFSKSRPTFFFAHTEGLHSPVYLNKSCKAAPREPIRIFEGRHINTGKAIVEHTQCINKQIERLISGLLQKDPAAIIVLSGDHSLRPLLREKINPQNPVHQRTYYAILNALRLPERCRSMLSDSISSVNTFRIVTACIDGTNPDFLTHKLIDHPR